MAMIYQPLELRNHPGRWRYVGASDESKGCYDECCDCDRGHASPEEATNCPIAKARADKIFGRDLASLERKVSSKRRELESAEAELTTKKAEP